MPTLQQKRLLFSGNAALRYTRKVKDLGPIAYWPEGEPSGTVSLDESGNSARNGVYTGVTLGNPGIGDGRTSAGFDGATSKNNIYSASLAAAFNGSESTVAGWAQVANAGVWTDATLRVIVALWVNGNNRAEIIKNTTNNQIVMVYDSGAVVQQFVIGSVSTLSPFHVALTWSKSADQAKAYLNGVQQGATQTGLGVWVGSLAATTTVIGARTTTPTSVWSGSLAHLAVWNRALAAAEVASLAVVP